MKDKPIKEPRSEQERLLDEALAETFPASDPISVQQIVIVGQVERPLRGGGGGGGGSGAKTSGAKTSGAKTSGVKTSGVRPKHRQDAANRLGVANWPGSSGRISAA